MLYLIVGALIACTAYLYFTADNRDDRPTSRSQSHKSSHPPVPRRDERQHWQIIDSSQRDVAPVEAYASLRTRAKHEGDLMAESYRQSKEAYERRDRARAKSLSEDGKRHALEMEKLNAEASAAIFKGNFMSAFSWPN